MITRPATTIASEAARAFERYPHLVAGSAVMPERGFSVALRVYCSKCRVTTSVEVLDDQQPGDLEKFFKKVLGTHAHPDGEGDKEAAAREQAAKVATLRFRMPDTHRAIVAAVAARLAGDIYAEARAGTLAGAAIDHLEIGGTAVDIADAVLLAMAPRDAESAP